MFNEKLFAVDQFISDSIVAYRLISSIFWLKHSQPHPCQKRSFFVFYILRHNPPWDIASVAEALDQHLEKVIFDADNDHKHLRAQEMLIAKKWGSKTIKSIEVMPKAKRRLELQKRRKKIIYLLVSDASLTYKSREASEIQLQDF